MPALLHALPHDARKPSGVHGLPSELTMTRVLCLLLAAASSATLSGAPTGIMTRVPVFD